MRINMRGGGDIASNPARKLARKRTDDAYEADLKAERDMLMRIFSWESDGARTPDSRSESTRGVQGDSGHGSPPQKPATGLEGGLNANGGEYPPRQFATIAGDAVEAWRAKWALTHPKDEHGCIKFENTLDHAFGSAEWRKLTQPDGGFRCECGSSDAAQHGRSDVNTASPYRECWSCYRKRKALQHPPKDGAHP